VGSGQVNTVNVYGFTSNSSTFSTSNYGEGTLLGAYTNLSALSYGEQDLMNITSFVDSVQTSDFGILLQAVGSNEGPDVLSSTRYFDGEPSAIEDLPEPPTQLLLLSGLIFMLLFARGRILPLSSVN
jgi:hypothetical protein